MLDISPEHIRMAHEDLESLVKKGHATKKKIDGEMKYFPIPDLRGRPQIYCQSHDVNISYCERVSRIHDTSMLCGSPGCNDVATMISTKYTPSCPFKKCSLYYQIEEHKQELHRRMGPPI